MVTQIKRFGRVLMIDQTLANWKIRRFLNKVINIKFGLYKALQYTYLRPFFGQDIFAVKPSK